MLMASAVLETNVNGKSFAKVKDDIIDKLCNCPLLTTYCLYLALTLSGYTINFASAIGFAIKSDTHPECFHQTFDWQNLSTFLILTSFTSFLSLLVSKEAEYNKCIYCISSIWRNLPSLELFLDIPECSSTLSVIFGYTRETVCISVRRNDIDHSRQSYVLRPCTIKTRLLLRVTKSIL